MMLNTNEHCFPRTQLTPTILGMQWRIEVLKRNALKKLKYTVINCNFFNTCVWNRTEYIQSAV